MCRGAAIRFRSYTPIEQAPAAWYPTNSGSLPPTELLIELVRAGLASAHAERMVADGKMTEVARMKLSEAGWQALADDAINVRAKST